MNISRIRQTTDQRVNDALNAGRRAHRAGEPQRRRLSEKRTIRKIQETTDHLGTAATTAGKRSHKTEHKRNKEEANTRTTSHTADDNAQATRRRGGAYRPGRPGNPTEQRRQQRRIATQNPAGANEHLLREGPLGDGATDAEDEAVQRSHPEDDLAHHSPHDNAETTPEIPQPLTLRPRRISTTPHTCSETDTVADLLTDLCNHMDKILEHFYVYRERNHHYNHSHGTPPDIHKDARAELNTMTSHLTLSRAMMEASLDRMQPLLQPLIGGTATPPDIEEPIPREQLEQYEPLTLHPDHPAQIGNSGAWTRATGRKSHPAGAGLLNSIMLIEKAYANHSEDLDQRVDDPLKHILFRDTDKFLANHTIVWPGHTNSPRNDERTEHAKQAWIRMHIILHRIRPGKYPEQMLPSAQEWTSLPHYQQKEIIHYTHYSYFGTYPDFENYSVYHYYRGFQRSRHYVTHQPKGDKGYPLLLHCPLYNDRRG